jgi:hypothetical protein
MTTRMHDHFCLDCGRFLTNTDAPDGTRQRLYCASCRDWKRLTLGPGTREARQRRSEVTYPVAGRRVTVLR